MMHQGYEHIIANSCLQFFLGPAMEIMHGTAEMIVFYVIVLAFGSMSCSWWVPWISCVGCSGAVFGLLGQWYIDLFLNWSEFPNAFLWFTLATGIFGWQIGMDIYKYFYDPEFKAAGTASLMIHMVRRMCVVGLKY